MSYHIREEHYDTFGFIDRDIYPLGCDILEDDLILQSYDLNILTEILDSALVKNFDHWKINVSKDNFRSYIDVINHLDNKVYEYILNERILEITNNIFDLTPNTINLIKRLILNFFFTAVNTKYDGIGEIRYINDQFYIRDVEINIRNIIAKYFHRLDYKFNRVNIELNYNHIILLDNLTSYLNDDEIIALALLKINGNVTIPYQFLNKIVISNKKNFTIKNKFKISGEGYFNNTYFKKIDSDINFELPKKIYGLDQINLIQYHNRCGDDMIVNPKEKTTLLDFIIYKFMLYPESIFNKGTYWFNKCEIIDNELVITYTFRKN